MTDLTRRTALYGIAAGSAAALAGCTGTGDPVSGGDGADGDGSDGNDGTDGNDTDGGDGADGDGAAGEVTTAVQQVGSALSGPSWDRTQRRGFCLLITEGDGDGAWPSDEAPAEARTFVEETDFSESVVLYAESVGPTTCHDETSFDAVGVEDGTLVADATVEGAEGEDVACGEAVTYSAALLRVTADPLPDAARLSVTDGWGETGTVRDSDWVSDS